MKVSKYLFLPCALFLMSCGDSGTDAADNLTEKNQSSEQEFSSADSAQEGLNSSDSESPASSAAGDASENGESDEGDGTSSASGSSAGSVAEDSSEKTETPAGDSATSDGSAKSPASSASGAPASSAESASPNSSSEIAVPASSAAAFKIFLANAEEEKDGVDINYIENTGYDGKGILAYPKQLSSDENTKHAVVVWGPGGDTEPGAYGGMIRRLASHGFVVIAISISPGTGDNMVAALDWMEKKNKDASDPLYNKLDLNRVGCAGHSMGGLESEQAAIKDSRVYTIVLNNSGDKQHKAMSEISKDKTMLNIYGEAGIERENARADYNNAGVVGGACLIQMVGGPQGGEGGWGHGSASWSGIAGTIAWMRWQLGGEDRKSEFVGTSGKYINGPIIGAQGNWDGQCKNF